MPSIRLSVPGRRHWISSTSCVDRPRTSAVVQLPVTAASTGSLATSAELTVPIGIAVTILLLSLVVAFDFRTMRRVHPATIVGAAVTLLVPMLAPPLAATAPALAFADLFR